MRSVEMVLAQWLEEAAADGEAWTMFEAMSNADPRGDKDYWSAGDILALAEEHARG